MVIFMFDMRYFYNLKNDRSYRTSMRTLKRLAQSDVFFCADPAKMTAFKELPLKNLGYVVTRYIARNYRGDRAKAIEHSITKLSRILPLGNLQKWSADQQIALQRLAPLVSCIPGLAKWSKQEKAGLVEIIKAKGEPQARQYALLCNKHPRFRQAIEKLAFGWKK
jgi:hypothetical protein